MSITCMSHEYHMHTTWESHVYKVIIYFCHNMVKTSVTAMEKVVSRRLSFSDRILTRNGHENHMHVA